MVPTTLGLLAVGSSHADEAIFAPFDSPRISDQPILLGTLLSITVEGHSMIDHIVGATVEDTCLIRKPFRCRDRDGDWPLLDQSANKWCFLVARKCLPPNQTESMAFRLPVAVTIAVPITIPLCEDRHCQGSARSVLPLVWCLCESSQSTLQSISHSEFDRSSITTSLSPAVLRILDAGHQLLGREAPAFANVDLVVCIQDTGRRHCPARPA
mmetsp:Transcript_6405/g.9114  ORF Transcript_6405/g.9114 Transcript_6405/m.9114 type:complete len:212 (-) Transcript_6405:112-747(-)